MLQNNLADKINAIGANTIMGSIANANLKEQVEHLEENNNSVADEGLDKITAAVLANNIRKHPIVKDHKISRNDPCPCGKTINGKPVKYKNCCLKTGDYETYTRI